MSLAGSLSDDAPSKPQVNPDARAVRLSSVDGKVRVVQDGQVVADPAYANMPIFEGSQISTADDGNAEIQFEDGSVVRLSPNSSITLPVLQKQGSGTRSEITVNGGLCYFELQPSNDTNGILVRLGPASFSPSSFSVIRVTLDQPPGNIAVFSGNVHVEQGNAVQVEVHGGESLALNASDPSNYKLDETIASDSWDSWNADRDQALNAQASEKTAASSKYGNSAAGFSDLDANGNWYDVPGQGYVWSPYDAQATGSAWDPYGYGNWVNYPGYGYLFVSGYDWGYAPFACGAWNFYDGLGWGWYPGAACNPWWGNYGYGPYGGWGYNVGRPPHGYLPPRRPGRGPGTPHPVGGGMHPVVAGRSNVIHVDHRPAGDGELSLNGGTHPVTIDGHTIEPMHPIVPRQAYSSTAAGFANRPEGPGGMHPGTTYGYGAGGSNTFRPSAPGYVPRAPSYAPPRSSSFSPSSGSHFSAPAPAPHFSAPSGGGMSGGGGGGHPSGGGGGSHH
ncbi:DUF6600 domain-containing protein [Acidicapsa dinghuensis]|uniref:DUF6600 domain-containing protein n=1 Tax=Acidicapsa dinghuensis TaxID=2218256 RepID=A0ABW1EI83_9BACT|nr:DUF6600 domain-containing protein [Acidicapsa dinghuensis]